MTGLSAMLLASASIGVPTAPPSPIYGGERTDGFDAVVAFEAGGGFCTGTVVAPRLVLTAAHCVADVSAAAKVTVYYGPEAYTAGSSVAAATWAAHPDFCPEKACGEEIFDIGYLTLPTDFVLPEYPGPVVDQDEWDSLIHPGEEVTLVGYGEANNDDPALPENGLGIKRMVTVDIERLTTGGLEFYAGGDGKDTCLGDSGGPALSQLEGGSLRLAGILSRGSSPCGKGGFYGVPYAGLCWIRDETGVDLLPDGCGSCDCLDTKPPDDCGCHADTPTHGPVGAMGLLLVVGLAGRLRRARSSW